MMMIVVMAIIDVMALKAENAKMALMAARYLFFDPLYVMLMIVPMTYADCSKLAKFSVMAIMSIMCCVH